ncbi:MAG: T9SS type A sorting domain-containing protein [Bacteroidetes bacterium]|nr:T9SS type A sorting domain-containing protein [Bacteroidota bacterium]
MKNIKLLIIGFFLTFGVNAQSTYLLDSTYSWYWGSSWFQNNKTYFLYDLDSNLLTEWDNYEKYIYTYDSNRNKTSEVFQIWDANLFVNHSQYIYTYDSNNNKLTKLFQQWANSTWENDEQNIYTYDSNNNLINILQQYWLVGIWKNNWQTFLTYDSSNNKLSQLQEYWDFSGASWDTTDLYLWSYDSFNNQLTWRLQRPNGNLWVDDSRYLYSYDSNNNFTNSLYQLWRSGIWKNISQDIYSYDVNNNQTYNLSQVWDTTASLWKNYNQYFYNYDVNNKLINNLYQTWHLTSWINMAQRFFTYDPNNNMYSQVYQQQQSGSWLNIDSLRYYYSNSLGISILEINPGIILYPIPTNNILYIKIRNLFPSDLVRLEIYNSEGKNCYQKIIANPNTEIKLELNLNSGNYLISIFNGHKYYTRKFIVAN